MRQAVAKANPVLLEPVMKVEVETPSEYQGSVIGDLSSRRGVIYGSEVKGDDTVINSGVPLAENVWLCNNSSLHVCRKSKLHNGI